MDLIDHLQPIFVDAALVSELNGQICTIFIVCTQLSAIWINFAPCLVITKSSPTRMIIKHIDPWAEILSYITPRVIICGMN